MRGYPGGECVADIPNDQPADAQKDTVKQGVERQVSFPFILCLDKEPVGKGGSEGKEG
jgi:hypothetical protein